MSEARTLEELVARYEMEPDLTDIYVEGPSDKALLESFFDAYGRNDIAVYPIETVNVTTYETSKHKTENNNRGRVIALARHLAAELGEQIGVSAVIDADLDHFFGIAERCALVVTTDYTSMDMYFFDAVVFRRFIRLCLEGFPLDEHELITALQPVLEDLFFIRVANQILQLKLRSLSFTRCCSVTRSGINFDTKDFITRYLHKSGHADRFDIFCKTVRECQRRSNSLDPRLKMHGHDFAELLAWVAKQLKSKAGLSEARVISKMLRACTEPKWLAHYGLFMELSRRCRL